LRVDWLYLKEIKERVGRVRVMPAEGLKTVLSMHKNDGIARFEKIFGGRGPSRACNYISLSSLIL